MQETKIHGFYPWGWENVLGEEMATHSSLLVRNPMDRGAWQATLHTVAELDTMEAA